MAQQENKQVKSLMTIDVKEHQKFNDVISTATLTSSDLEESVASLVHSVFDDFEGCKIVQDLQSQRLVCKLYFKLAAQKTEEGLYAVKHRGELNNRVSSGHNTVADMVNSVNAMAITKNASTLQLTDDAKELLAEFLLIPNNNAQFVDRYSNELNKAVKVRLPKNWNLYTEEISEPVMGNFSNAYLVVNVDLTLLVGKLYGKKDEEEVKVSNTMPKDRYQYAVNIVKVLNVQTKSYILEVRRIDINSMKKLTNRIGYGTIQGGIVMTRATR